MFSIATGFTLVAGLFLLAVFGIMGAAFLRVARHCIGGRRRLSLRPLEGLSPLEREEALVDNLWDTLILA